MKFTRQLKCTSPPGRSSLTKRLGGCVKAVARAWASFTRRPSVSNASVSYADLHKRGYGAA